MRPWGESTVKEILPVYKIRTDFKAWMNKCFNINEVGGWRMMDFRSSEMYFSVSYHSSSGAQYQYLDFYLYQSGKEKVRVLAKEFLENGEANPNRKTFFKIDEPNLNLKILNWVLSTSSASQHFGDHFKKEIDDLNNAMVEL